MSRFVWVGESCGPRLDTGVAFKNFQSGKRRGGGRGGVISVSVRFCSLGLSRNRNNTTVKSRRRYGSSDWTSPRTEVLCMTNICSRRLLFCFYASVIFVCFCYESELVSLPEPNSSVLLLQVRPLLCFFTCLYVDYFQVTTLCSYMQRVIKS